MEKRKLIIQLIQHDLKQNQLVSGLEKLGLDATVHHSHMLEIVGELMEKPQDLPTVELWCETYLWFLEQSSTYEITSSGENLNALAIACYRSLYGIIKEEQTANSEDYD